MHNIIYTPCLHPTENNNGFSIKINCFDRAPEGTSNAACYLCGKGKPAMIFLLEYNYIYIMYITKTHVEPSPELRILYS